MSKDPIAIFADQLRTEDNGKLLIIGVYAGVMTVPAFPWAGSLTPLLIFPELQANEHVTIDVETSTGEVLLHGEADIVVDGDMPPAAYLPLPPFNLAITAEGEIVIKAKIADGETMVAGRLKVVQSSPSE